MSSTKTVPATQASPAAPKRKVASIVFLIAVVAAWVFAPSFADLPATCQESVPEWVPAFAKAQRTLVFAMTLFAIILIIRSRLTLAFIYTLILLLIVVVSFIAFTCP